jgi:hypothetical protein
VLHVDPGFSSPRIVSRLSQENGVKGTDSFCQAHGYIIIFPEAEGNSYRRNAGLVMTRLAFAARPW